jgi:kumamolisin
MAWLSQQEFEQRHGATAEDVAKVRRFAQEFGLTVMEHPQQGSRRIVTLSGTVEKLEQAFGVQLNEYHCEAFSYRGREGAVQVPQELAAIVQAVLGLDNRPQAKTHYRWREAPGTRRPGAAAATSYTPVQVAQLYKFPSDVTGAGQTIGIIELGGGYRPADIQNYFQNLGVTAPAVTSVLVDGGKNSPSDPNGADGEVMLDIEVSGAVAQGAKIVVYFAPNTDQGFLDALTMAVHDTTNKPSVVSISWGGPEANWTAQAMTAMDQAAQAAASLGVTITVASGDSGSSDGVTDGGNHVDFPASSPHVLGCGGTSLKGSGSAIASETVWNDGSSGGATGGGYSVQFAKPSWQSFTASGRGVPDVAGDADPNTGYDVLLDGQTGVIGGTSAVAPLWAGLIALLNQKLGKPLGFVNPDLYADEASFRDITSGNNGAYSAGPGWDATTGLGSPDGEKLEKTLG